MPTISIKQLHAATGKWVRAARHEPVHVTDRGKLTAVLTAQPLNPKPSHDLAARFKWMPVIGGDSTAGISAERDER
jgi:antitoxin (DNA-binding transcriptional repressor) of toxin-antitoxin stability system